jgi:hypothetical protein
MVKEDSSAMKKPKPSYAILHQQRRFPLLRIIYNDRFLSLGAKMSVMG